MSAPGPATAMPAGSGGPLRIGDWLLDVERNELRRGSESARLERKAVEVLHQLALRPGRVIGREELLALVWPGVVVGDDALTQAIIKLRKALGDDAQSPRYIETIPKRGYRLVATVATAAEASGAPAIAPTRRVRAAAIGASVALGAAVLLAVPALLDRAKMPWPLGSDAREATPAAAFPLVAVLPLSNLSGDAKRDHLSDGFTEDLIDALGRFSGLRVMSRNAVQAFKGKDPSGQVIRDELRVRYVVRGSVREADGTIRVAVELADAEKGVQLWSERYDAKGAELFEIQDRMVRDIVGALAVKLTDAERQRAFTRPTASAEAYELVLRARALLDVDQRGPNREARVLLSQAEKLAPEYAEVWIAQGEAEWRRAAFGWIEDAAEGVRRAEAHARRALTSPDPRTQVRAHSLLASLRTHLGHPEEALRHTERAIAINPSDSSALFRHGHALLTLGRLDEAITTIETAMRYEPRPNIGPHLQLAQAYYLAGRYQDALAYLEMVQSFRPDGGVHTIRAAALAQLGRIEEARVAAEAVRRWSPGLTAEGAGTRLKNPEHAARLREGLAKAGL